MKNDSPAISIIIPMYNAEKYIVECLDSILAQTFTDYEVIIVDDGSKDRSCEIVESYLPKFEGKLKLIRLKKNSGSGVIARNTGIKTALGKYLMFIDNDDAITKTALEELFQAAEKFQADVVHCGPFYRADENDSLAEYENLKIVIGARNIITVNQPIVLNYDLAERAKNFGANKFNITPWNYLFNREFIIKNKFEFPPITHGDDEFFAFCVLCKAKTFVLIPNVYYIYRIRANSLNRAPLNVEKHIHEWFGSALRAIALYDKFMDQFEEFKNLELRYQVFALFADNNISYHIYPFYAQNPIWEVDKFIRRELDDIEDKTALTAFLFTRMNIFNLRLLQLQQAISQKDAQIKDLERQLSEAYNVFTR